MAITLDIVRHGGIGYLISDDKSPIVLDSCPACFHFKIRLGHASIMIT